MRLSSLSGALAAALLLLPLAAAASPAPGMQLNGVLAADLNTKTTVLGQRVELSNVVAADGSGQVTNGHLYGSVTDVVKASQGKAAQLHIQFTRLVTSDGTYAIDGSVTNMDAKTKSNVTNEVIGGVGGMLLGNVLGKTVFHSGAGGLIGAAGGYIFAKNAKQDMTVAQGSIVTVTLVSERRQASYNHY